MATRRNSAGAEIGVPAVSRVLSQRETDVWSPDREGITRREIGAAAKKKTPGIEGRTGMSSLGARHCTDTTLGA